MTVDGISQTLCKCLNSPVHCVFVLTSGEFQPTELIFRNNNKRNQIVQFVGKNCEIHDNSPFVDDGKRSAEFKTPLLTMLGIFCAKRIIILNHKICF